MDFRIQVALQPLFLRYSRVYIFLRRELMNLLVQPPFNLFLCWIPVTRHQTSFMQILVSATEPFVGLYAPDPGSEMI